MSLALPKLLWLAMVVPLLVIAYALDGQRRRRVLERIGHLPMIAQMTESLSSGRRRLQSVCTVLAVGAMAIAVARPQAAGRARLNESRGLDLVIALDLSRSMLARDVYPSRLERAKAEVSRLLDELKGDRVGLVAFAGETLSYPLTTDYEAAKLFWRDLQPGDMPVGGTDLGRAVSAATELLDRSAARTPQGKRRPAQVILLITDGEDTEARGLDAARAAFAHGIRIYAVAIGSKERPFVPITDEDGKPSGYVSGSDGEPVRVGVDEEGLKKMAALTGGEYFAVEPHHFGVERVQQAIAGLERTEEEARLEREPEDIGRWFVLAAFILLALGATIGDRRRRVVAGAIALSPLSPSTGAKGREPTGQRPAGRESPGRRDASGRRNLPAAPALGLLLVFPLLGGFDLFLRRDPDLEAGNQALAAGKAEEALAAYDRAAAARPDDATVRYDRGAALLQLGKLPEATRELQRAVETHDPSLKADAYYNLGLAQHKQEHFKEAVEAYKRALTLKPDDRRTKWNLEVAQRRLKEQREQKQKDPQQAKDQQQKDQDQKDQQQAQQQQKDQQQKDQQQKDQQQKDQQQQSQQGQQQKDQAQKDPQQAQKDQAQKDQAQKDQAQKDQAQKDPQQKDQPGDRQSAQAGKTEPPREKGSAGERAAELDRQDAEAVLDALEHVEPTVQKDLARRRAGGRKPKKDW